jgi:hypothetical protein
LAGLSIVAFTRARTQVFQATKNQKYESGEPVSFYKILLLNAILFTVGVLFWPLFLSSWFGKKRTMLDDAQETSGKLVVKGYRRIAAQLGCAPTAKTTDQKIMEIYSTVSTAFNQAAERRGEHIPALYLNTIVLKFLKVYELFYGSPFPQRFQEHLQYEVNKYLAEGLRPDYKQELPLFDPDDFNDPDVKQLRELQRLVREKLEREFLPKENKPPVLSNDKNRIR